MTEIGIELERRQQLIADYAAAAVALNEDTVSYRQVPGDPHGPPTTRSQETAGQMSRRRNPGPPPPSNSLGAWKFRVCRRRYAACMASYGPVERATRAELRALEVSVQASGAAAALIATARQLDKARGAASAAAAARELRLGLAALRAGPSLGVDPEVAEFLAGFAQA